MRTLFSKLVAIAAVLAFIAPSPVSASHASPIYSAADAYRDVVKDFERAVLRSPYIDRHRERLVDDLEDSTSDLRSAARRPEDLDRLLRKWHITQSLHQRVESAIFGNPNCPSRVDLIGCWERVVCAFTTLAEQIAQIQCVSPVHHVPSFRVPVAPVPNYRAPLNSVPHYRAPTHSVPNYRAPRNSVPNYRVPGTAVPNRNVPEAIAPPRNVPNNLHPSNWNPHRRSPVYWPGQSGFSSPHWNSSRSLTPASRTLSTPASARPTSPSWLQAADAERNLHRTVSSRGIDAATIAALISRWIN